MEGSSPRRFNPLHRGIGLLTSCCFLLGYRCSLGFNPLHRGIGLLTWGDYIVGDLDGIVSILFIEASVF